ncbi:hypothetical protein ACKWTF_001504 [Chironomus riparius]
MSKRARESDVEMNMISKIRKISTILEDENNNDIPTDQQVIIPTEIIANIMSYLDDTNDIKSCMLVSQEVRDFIFTTPKIMKRFLVKLDFEWYEAIDFIQQRGKFIRHLDLDIGCQDRKHLKFILNQMPNLESLSYNSLDFAVGGYCTDDDDIPTEKNLATLTKLKNLKINQNDLKDFMEGTKNVTNLDKLIVYGDDAQNQDLLTDFVVQQNKLKELNLSNRSFSGFITFPVRDIFSEVKFRLKSFRLSYYNNYGFFNYTKFLQSQAESLEELDLEYTPGQEVFDVIFGDLKNLKKLTLDPYYGAPIFSDFYQHYRRDSVRVYEDKFVLGVNTQKVFSRFPNLETLKCVKFNEAVGRFDKLATLDIQHLNCTFLINLELPNLKNLTIQKVSRIYFENLWRRFASNVQNVEHITIKRIKKSSDLIYIVKNLNMFRNLKTFKFRHLRNFNRNYKMDDDEIVSKNHKFFKILIDTDEKTIKVCNYIVHNCKEILDSLKVNFVGFEFVEFCFHKNLSDEL